MICRRKSHFLGSRGSLSPSTDPSARLQISARDGKSTDRGSRFQARPKLVFTPSILRSEMDPSFPSGDPNTVSWSSPSDSGHPEPPEMFQGFSGWIQKQPDLEPVHPEHPSPSQNSHPKRKRRPSSKAAAILAAAELPASPEPLQLFPSLRPSNPSQEIQVCSSSSDLLPIFHPPTHPSVHPSWETFLREKWVFRLISIVLSSDHSFIHPSVHLHTTQTYWEIPWISHFTWLFQKPLCLRTVQPQEIEEGLVSSEFTPRLGELISKVVPSLSSSLPSSFPSIQFLSSSSFPSLFLSVSCG